VKEANVPPEVPFISLPGLMQITPSTFLMKKERSEGRMRI